MNKSQDICNPIVLHRFFDNELGPEEHARTREHVRQCPSCQESLQKNRSLSDLFVRSVEKAVSQTNFDALEKQVLSRVESGKRKKEKGKRKKENLFSGFSRRILVPAAAMAGIVLLVFSLTGPPESAPGPSAIINSFTGDISSVMIMETPKSRQTIIWFNESQIPEGEKDEVKNLHHTDIVCCSGRMASSTGPV